MNMTLTTLYAYMNGNIYMVFNRNCFPKMTLFKVRPPTGSQVHRKSGSIKEMVQNRQVDTTDH